MSFNAVASTERLPYDGANSLEASESLIHRRVRDCMVRDRHHLHTVLQAANNSSSPCIREEAELSRSANGEEGGAVDDNGGVVVVEGVSVVDRVTVHCRLMRM